VPDISRTKAQSNLTLLARQQQDPAIDFHEITDTKPGGGQERILQKVLDGRFDLLILDNFSTLGRVADENAASSFDDIQSFLLKLKIEKVATILVHHTGKSDATFRGSTKLAATFEVMLHLKRYGGDKDSIADRHAISYGQAQFELEWHKLRNQPAVGKVIAKLTTRERQGQQVAYWDYSTGLDLLNALKWGLENGLYATKTEIATAAGRKDRNARDIIAKGIKHLVWTHAFIREGLSRGKKRREALETAVITEPSPIARRHFDDDDAALTASP
jgi:hypothetical protein